MCTGCQKSHLSIALFVTVVFACISPLYALNKEDRGAIEHLLRYIDHRSDCVFIRNGREYSAHEAARHVREKYIYFKDRIKTPEDFIRLADTRSLVTARFYKVQCGDGEMPVKDWLMKELSRYRQDVREKAFVK